MFGGLVAFCISALVAGCRSDAGKPYPPQPAQYPVFTGTYGSTLAEHRRFGLELGSRFRSGISAAVKESESDGILSFVKPFVQTPKGNTSLLTMIAAHTRMAPLYVEEVRGMAQGAQIPFADMFTLNVGESLGTIADPYTSVGPTPPTRPVEHCSDYIMWPFEAHNEDGAPADIPGMAFANVTIDGASFYGLVYAGMLPSGAFGWNSHGMGFTLNYVAPYDADVNGLGRNFVSRHLLRATSLDEAIDTATVAFPHATGHNFQLMSFVDHSICNVEVAPFDRHSLRCFNSSTPPFFHSNTYRTLKNITQASSASSLHRIARAAAMPVPKSPSDLLAVLGDQADSVQPIFHDKRGYDAGDKSGCATITTMLFDVAERTATQYHGNPKDGNVHRVFHL